MRSDFFPYRSDVRRFYLILGCLVVIAWGILFALQGSAFAELFSHESIGHDQFPSAWHVGAFLLSWTLMTVAMMLPANLPTLNQYIQSLRYRMNSSRRVGLLILGFLSPWVLFGLLGFLADGYLHRMFASPSPLADFSAWIAPSIILIAGLYQLTPIKRSFTMRCQLSTDPLLEGRVEVLGGAATLKQGLRLGILCVGSCWSLMLLMFALGHNRLEWMLALGCIMAAERLAPWGYRLSWLVGLALIVWAMILALGSLPAGHTHH